MKREIMTAETLKPFISSPSSDNFSPEDPTVKRQTTAKLIRIGLNVTYVAFAVAVLVFMVWSSVRVSQLESEVKSVTRLVESMQKRLGLDYLDDLVDIEKEYTNDLIDDSNSDDDEEEDEVLGGVLSHNSDPADYDDDDDDNDEDDDEEDDALLGGANGNYDDDDDDDGIRTRNNKEEEEAKNEKQDREDDISTAYPDDSEGDSYENDDNLYDDFEKYKDAKKLSRKVRSIVQSAPNDLPVYEESYALRRNKSGGPEDELIERHLLTNRNKTPSLRPQQRGSNVEAVDGVKLKETNKRHLASSGGNRRTRHRLHQSSTRSRGSSHLTQMRLHNRKIRAMMKSANKLGKPQALVATARVAAAHYHLNSTISGKHILHPSHSTLAHDGDVYIGAPHIWTKHLGMEKFFRINYGVLIVEQSGLYLVYAQIYYDNRYDRNGFVLYHNTHAFLQCAAYIPTNINKSHTCHTSGLIYLEQNDELHLRDIHRDRVVSLTNAKSFFGLVKIDGTA